MTNLWPKMDEVLARDDVVHRTTTGKRVTVDLYFHDESMTYASFRRVEGRGAGAQVEPSLPISSTDGPDSALPWFILELAAKVRGSGSA
jgi:hypothetical protein